MDEISALENILTLFFDNKINLNNYRYFIFYILLIIWTLNCITNLGTYKEVKFCGSALMP